jgi:hypothetical protein
VNGLTGNRDEVAGILGPDALFTGTSTQFLANLHSKFECPPIMKIVFPEKRRTFIFADFELL